MSVLTYKFNFHVRNIKLKVAGTEYYVWGVFTPDLISTKLVVSDKCCLSVERNVADINQIKQTN
jgi:hypothetical protein